VAQFGGYPIPWGAWWRAFCAENVAEFDREETPRSIILALLHILDDHEHKGIDHGGEE
jgi:hypothetical protein